MSHYRFLTGALALVVIVGLSGVAQATDVLPGSDFFTTGPGGAVLDLGGGGTPDPDDDLPPIPADFFFPGSPPVTGVIPFEGVPLGPGCDADTIVERLSLATLPDPVPTSDTIPIELVALSLTSVDPITVGTTEWDIDVTLSSTDPSLGAMTIFHSAPTGGTYDASIVICAVHTFTQVVGPSPGTTMVLENCADLGTPLTVGVLGQLWGHDPPPPPVGPPCAAGGPDFFILGPQFDSGPHPVMNPGKETGVLCGDTFPTCDGECPPGLTCQVDPLECICVPPSVPMSTPWSLVALALTLLAAVALAASRLPYFRKA